MTKTGGLDTAAGAVNVRDVDPGPPTTFAAGYYLEGNIIADVEQLVRNYDPAQTLVSFVNNLLPMPWAGPGSSNRVADPMLKHIPELTETAFTNWTSAQVLWDWFSLLPGSPGLASGPDGWDQGGAIPPGVALVGEPPATTDQTSATVSVGPNRRGLVPVVSWPDGAGYVGYKWQLDGGPWSAEFPVTSPIVLTNLAPGPHQLAVLGKNDAGTFQNDPVLGTNAVVTLSRVWTVQASFGLTSASRLGNEVVLQVSGQGGKTYAVEFTDSLATPSWAKLADVTVDPRTGQGTLSAPLNSAAARFFRLSAASP